MEELTKTRLELAKGRLREITEEEAKGAWDKYFREQSRLLLLCEEILFTLEKEIPTTDILREWNRLLYADILPEHYEESWTNPEYAVSRLGKEAGQLAAVAAAEFRSAIPCAFEAEADALVIRMELMLELYGIVDGASAGEPVETYVRGALYSYVSDYYETECERRVAQMVDPAKDHGLKIIMESDFSKTDYLYRYGEYITENELRLADYINRLPEEKIRKIADTYTEGYRIGFINSGKDLGIKGSVNIRYPLGFERVVRRAVANFEKMGLKSVIYRATDCLHFGRSVQRIGYYGAIPNEQYDYDHKDDVSLLIDGALVTRHLECLEAGFKVYREQAKKHAGPAVIETFGENPFQPRENEYAVKPSAEARGLGVRYRTEAGKITNQYIPGEERSFTIIAFPVPAIGEHFEEIFDAVLEVNTLDYTKYQRIQSVMIEALNSAACVHVQGKGENRTDLTVRLQTPKDVNMQAIFENCVADVNIPVGEIFTTPELAGTEGVLHVSRVYLKGLEFKDLELTFRDGEITDYHCDNFDDPEANRRYIEENILMHHKTLPIGEAAIGTNTTAYAMARRYGIEERLPILIAEKTGPHFAVGDTCYSHAEEVAVYNPDGKEIFARENAYSRLRDTEPQKAYFNCHTDITLPYDELGLLEGVRADGSRVTILKDGRFVLAGTEELNEPLDAEEK